MEIEYDQRKEIERVGAEDHGCTCLYKEKQRDLTRPVIV